MNPIAWVRTNWRIAVLVVMVLISAYFLFVPGAPISGPAAADAPNATGSDRPTNLQYGIDLDGGAQITAPVKGLTAEEVPISTDDPAETREREREVRAAVADAMDGVGEGDVRTYTRYDQTPGDEVDVVEVRAEGDPAQFAQGLQNAGYDVSEEDVRRGVTETTRRRIVQVLDDRLGEAGFGGGSVTQVRTGEEVRIQVEAPGRDLAELESVVSERGLVQQFMHYPDPDDPNNATEEEILRGEDITEVGAVQRDESGQPYVRVELTQEAASRMQQRMVETGFADNPSDCRVPEGEEPGPQQHCLITRVDNETVYTAGIRPDLAESFRSGEFETTQSYLMTANSFEQAQELRLNLEAGALPAELDLERSDDFLVNPALAQDFRSNALLTGIIAVLAVVVMVFLRYGDPRVAVPMSATALSEVGILLGFAAAIGWPLQLAHVAGFIAVIGTGVDDLIIIADEVMSEGDVRSHTVFDNRFRKAFWVIGAAAATTIIAMSPLAVLDLGDLRGFAIVTILGVLIGVAVTRPAYGNILRSLKTEGR